MPSFYGNTFIHPVALGATVLSGFLILFLPRRYVIVPLIVSAIVIPQAQRIVVMGLDFMIFRILILFGWMRVIFQSEYHSLELNVIDKAMIWWGVARTITYTILWQSTGAFINRLGGTFDALGIYFLIRILFQDFSFDDFRDVDLLMKILVYVCVLLGVAMLIERFTRWNMFSLLGGVPKITTLRDGKLRCQGAFSHPILAGTFGAALFPLFAAYWKSGRARMLGILGVLSAIIIMVNSSSSGPVIAFVMGIFGMLAWRWRENMRAIRWGIALSIVALHIYMKAPVWAIVMKLKVFGASTGGHRYYLIDQFIKRFGEWFLVGTRHPDNWGMLIFDVTNHYIRIAVDGGFITLVLFITIIVFCFQSIGRAIRDIENNFQMQIIIWAIGTSLFTHIVSFIGVSYFDQIIVIWYMTLGLISTFRHVSGKIELEREQSRKKAARKRI